MHSRLISVLCVSLAFWLTACVEMPTVRPPSYKVSTTPPAGAEPIVPPLPSIKSALPPLPPIPDSVPTVKVGLLLPLSGDQQALGQAMLDAATLALYDQYFVLQTSQIRAKIVLMPKDTGNSPTTAVAAAETLISQGAQLLVGPVFSPYVTAITPVARKAGVPMLSLSNNRAVAGENVYVYGFLPEQQASRIAEFASLQNIASFASLAPNDVYGKTVSEAFVTALGARGIRVSPVETYAARSAVNLEAAVNRLRTGYDRTPFQSLFIAEGGESLQSILGYLKTQQMGRESVRLLGTGLWDEEDVFKMPEMEGAWFSSAAANYYRPFAARFTAVYGYKPQRIASLAYDAVALAATLSQQAGGASFAQATLTRAEGFVGPANGLYRLYKNGANERALAVIEIRNGKPKVADPAPLTLKRPKE